MVLPDPAGLPYVPDMKWLGKVRQAARARYRDHQLDISDCGAKVRKLIEEAIAADGVEILVKEVSLFSKEFETKVEALVSPEAKASEMEHAIRHEIHVRLEENPAFYESLREKLQKIIEDRAARRIDAAKQLELLKFLAAEVKSEASAAQEAGLTDMGFAIYGVLEKSMPVPKAGEPVAEYQASRQKLAVLIEDAIAPFADIPGWTEKAQVQKDMRRAIKDRSAGSPGARRRQARRHDHDHRRRHQGPAGPMMAERSSVQYGRTTIPFQVRRSAARSARSRSSSRAARRACWSSLRRGRPWPGSRQ